MDRGSAPYSMGDRTFGTVTRDHRHRKLSVEKMRAIWIVRHAFAIVILPVTMTILIPVQAARGPVHPSDSAVEWDVNEGGVE